MMEMTGWEWLLLWDGDVLRPEARCLLSASPSPALTSRPVFF
jgi:hypothetical protein